MVADVLPQSFLHEETGQTSKRSHRTKLPELLGSTHSFLFMTQDLPQGIPGIALCTDSFEALPQTPLYSSPPRNVNTDKVFLFLISGFLIIMLRETCFLGCLDCAHLVQSSFLLWGKKTPTRQNHFLLPHHERSYPEMLTKYLFHLTIPLFIKFPP